MRKIGIVLCAILFFACNGHKEEGYTLSGNFKGIESGKITFGYWDWGNQKMVVVDSTTINKGKFFSKRRLESPNQLYARITPGDYSFAIFMENSKIEILGNIKGIVPDRWGRKVLPVSITGSKTQAEFDALEKSKEPILAQLKPFSKAYDNANEEYIQAKKNQQDKAILEALATKVDEAKQKMDPFYEQLDKVELNYIEQNTQSYIAAYLLSSRVSSIPLDKGIVLYSQFSQEVKSSYFGKVVKSELKKLKSGSPGSKAAVFTTRDIHGEILNLSDFRGQYLLIDFWASWCKPCRESNPHLIHLYQKYHEKGVEFIGISDDDSNPAAWRRAVEKDGIGIWRHVLRGLEMKDGQYNHDNDISEGYAIHTLPTKILIGPNGIIIGRYGGGGDDDEAMDRKFEEIFEWR